MPSSAEEIRRALRLRRSRLGMRARYAAARRLAKASKTLSQGQHVALYLATSGELSCYFLLRALWRQGKTCYLPVLSHPNPDKRKENWMGFRLYSPGKRLIKNHFGIFEPADGQLRKSSDLDWVAVPLVACDKQGKRIGMGGGYYDRCFAYKKQASLPILARKPSLIGVAYRFQQCHSIIAQPWDVSLDDCWLV